MSRFSNTSGRTALRALCVLGIAVLGATGLADTALGAAEPLRYAVLFDAPSAENERVLESYMQEFTRAVGTEYAVQPAAAALHTADNTRAGLEAALTEIMSRDDIDLVLTLGVLGSEIVAEREQVAHYTVAAFLLPAELRPGAGRGALPRAERVVATELPMRPERDLERMQELFDIGSVALLVPELYAEALPWMETALTERFAGRLFQYEVNAAATAVVEGLQAELPNARGALVLPVPGSERAELHEALNAAGIAGFGALGRDELERGAAVVLRGAGTERLAARAATELRELLRGAEAVRRVHAVRPTELLVMNTERLQAVGVAPQRQALLQAELHGEEREGALRLSEVVRHALEHNLDLAARSGGVDAAQAEARRARSRLLPQLDASTSFRVLDQDRAQSLVAPDQFSAVAGLEFTQVIWSEAAWAGVEIRRLLAESESHRHSQYKDDTAESAALAYIALLRARSLSELQRANIEQAEFNLERAETRRNLGEAGPADVFRFRSELALARNELAEALSLEHQARMQLNRVLNLPQRDLLYLHSHDLGDPAAVLASAGAFSELRNLHDLERLEHELVWLSFDNSSELAAIDAALGARSRERRSRQRAFFSPTVAFFAQIEHEYWSGGSSPDSEFGLALPPALGGAVSFDAQDLITLPGETQWAFGVRASIPLLTGGERKAQLERVDGELRSLELQAESLEAKIEQRTRTAFVRTVAAAEKALHGAEAAAAAQDALELVSRAYGLGLASAVDLVDAQNRAVGAETLAQDGSYRYLVEFTHLLRALGRTDALYLPEADMELLETFERLQQ